MPEYIYQVKTPIIRRFFMIPSVCALTILSIILVVCSILSTPKLTRIHINFGSAILYNAAISMWHGYKHDSFGKIAEFYYK